ncbi:MAG: HepT-like ribonuclease domain-containing protein [Bacteroidia bacterium]
MNREARKYLYDISQAISSILDDFLDDIHSLDQFETDKKTQAAVERMLMIIGEAVYKLQQQGIVFSSGDRIINRRNTLAHQYDAYNPYTIWISIQRELPGLKAEVEQLLNEQD